MRADSAGLDGCPFLARRKDRSSGHSGQGWAGPSLTATLISPVRRLAGVPAEPVADPAARRGEGDPQRIANDGDEQGGVHGQRRSRRAGRSAAMADDGHLGGGGAAAHPPHHPPVDRLPGKDDRRGEDYDQRPQGKGNDRVGNRPWAPHLAMIGLRRRWPGALVAATVARARPPIAMLSPLHKPRLHSALSMRHITIARPGARCIDRRVHATVQPSAPCAVTKRRPVSACAG